MKKNRAKRAQAQLNWLLADPARRLIAMLPRVPLPRQTGGMHKVKTKTLHRKRKHKGVEDE